MLRCGKLVKNNLLPLHQIVCTRRKEIPEEGFGDEVVLLPRLEVEFVLVDGVEEIESSFGDFIAGFFGDFFESSGGDSCVPNF